MFGLVKPYVPELRVRENDLYRAVYCGLCRELGVRCGRLSSFGLSYDFVFLALCRFALTGEGFSTVKKRCGFQPFKKRLMCVDAARICQNSANFNKYPPMAYSAAAAAVLTREKLRDDIADERGAKKLRARFALPFASRAVKKSGAPEAYSAAVAASLAKLSQTEAGGGSPDECADAFGETLAYIFAFGIDGGAMARVAGEIGRHTGRWIYLTDAALDYPDDLKSGAYNPYRAVLPDLERFDAARGTIREACLCELAKLRTCTALADMSDADVLEIIDNTVALGMTAVCEKTAEIQSGRGKSSAGGTIDD